MNLNLNKHFFSICKNEFHIKQLKNFNICFWICKKTCYQMDIISALSKQLLVPTNKHQHLKNKPKKKEKIQLWSANDFEQQQQQQKCWWKSSFWNICLLNIFLFFPLMLLIFHSFHMPSIISQNVCEDVPR